MLFASIELVARIEAAKCRLLAASVASAKARHPGAEILAQPLAGGIATWVGDDSPLNKVAGLGFGGPVDEAELEAVERAFARRGAPVQVELSTLAEPSIAFMLTARGYRITGFENILGLPLPTPPLTVDCDAEISVSGEPELDAWLDTLVTGFIHPDTQGVPSHEEFSREALSRAIGDMVCAEGFVRYLARREDRPAGGASMQVVDGIAQLCGASTVPEQRRRGIQTALLAARLRDAERAGCELAVVTTLPGSRSQHNVQRQGFCLLYTRAILVREPPPGD